MARMLCGFVIGVTFLLQTPSAFGDDRETAEKIAERLRTSGQLRNYDIRVKYADGTAWLRGRVASPEQMNVALNLAFQASGVEQVANGLTVWKKKETAKKPGAIGLRQEPYLQADEPRSVAGPLALSATSRVQSVPVTTTGRHVPPPAPAVEPSRSAVAATSRSTHFFPEPQRAREAVEYPETQLRRMNPIAERQNRPSSVQAACHWAKSEQDPSAGLQMVMTLAGATERMLLPEEASDLAGEAFASDKSTDEPALLASHEVAVVDAEPIAPKKLFPPKADSPEGSGLIQTVPEPSRRAWTGGFEHRLPLACPLSN